MTLGDASRKKYFNDLLFHFGQKMRLALRSMTFQTFCIFRTGYPKVLYFVIHTYLRIELQACGVARQIHIFIKSFLEIIYTSF